MNSDYEAAKTPVMERIRADHTANQIAARADANSHVMLPIRKVGVDATMFASINKQHGYRRVKVIRDVSGESFTTTPRLASERVFEVRYAEGPYRGQYTSFAERHLFESVPKSFLDHMKQIELYETGHVQVIHSRRETAQSVLDRYELGDDLGKPTCRDWDTSDPRELQCFVDACYVDHGDVQPVKLDFRVKFDAEGAVIDAYAHDMHLRVVGRRGDSGNPHRHVTRS